MAGSTPFSKSTAIGYNASITTSNQIVLGTSAEYVYIPGTIGNGYVNTTIYGPLLRNIAYGHESAYIDGASDIMTTTVDDPSITLLPPYYHCYVVNFNSPGYTYLPIPSTSNSGIEIIIRNIGSVLCKLGIYSAGSNNFILDSTNNYVATIETGPITSHFICINVGVSSNTSTGFVWAMI